MTLKEAQAIIARRRRERDAYVSKRTAELMAQGVGACAAWEQAYREHREIAG